MERGITVLVFVDGTMNVGFPTTGVCLALEVTPLTNDTTWARGFPPVVEDTGEPEADPGFGTLGTLTR